MSENKYLSISDFAKMSRLSRTTLLHYDGIGLLSPASRGDNKYRYYTVGQIAVVNVIRTLRELGLSLSEIKRLRSHRTPSNMSEILARQIDRVDEKIGGWVQTKKLLVNLKANIDGALSADEEKLTVRFMPAEKIVRGRINDYSGGRNDYDALIDFYDDISETYPEMNYPVWAVFSEDRIKRGDWRFPDRYYFCSPDGRDERPAAEYAVGYRRGGYGQSDELYKRLIAFIGYSGYEICGDAYEEYPLNEISVSDEEDYLLRVMITVCRKGKRRR